MFLLFTLPFSSSLSLSPSAMNGSSDPFADGGDDGDSGNPLAALGALLEASPIAPLVASLRQRQQRLLDASTPHVGRRWAALAALVLLYALRVWYLQGFYIVTYALGIYNLNLLLGFLTPQVRFFCRNHIFTRSTFSIIASLPSFFCFDSHVPLLSLSLPSLPHDRHHQIDPELEGPTLPSQRSDEFRPFQRRLPEFKFWWASARSVAASLAATLFPLLDVPVFWPILLVYFCALFFVTMRRQIRHMIKHRYIPFSLVSSSLVFFLFVFVLWRSGGEREKRERKTISLSLYFLPSLFLGIFKNRARRNTRAAVGKRAGQIADEEERGGAQKP